MCIPTMWTGTIELPDQPYCPVCGDIIRSTGVALAGTTLVCTHCKVHRHGPCRIVARVADRHPQHRRLDSIRGFNYYHTEQPSCTASSERPTRTLTLIDHIARSRRNARLMRQIQRTPA